MRTVHITTFLIGLLLLPMMSCKKSATEPDRDQLHSASVSVSPDIGTLNTSFRFNAILLDNGDTVNAEGYQIRWDWDGDEDYDTPWLDSLAAEHLYEALGKYVLKVQIKSPSGETSDASARAYVQQLKPILTTQRTDVSYEYADWSRDGTNRIAFTIRSEPNRRFRIGILQYPGATFDIVTPDGTDSYLLDWSYDGTMIAFCNGGGLGIYTIVSGARMNFPYTFDQRPSWSPDSRYIVYGNLLYDLADSSTSDIPVLGDFAWSPDGSKLAFVDGSDTLTIVSFPGYAVIQKHRTMGKGFKVEWSSNGEWISLGGDVSTARPRNFYVFNVTSSKVYSWRPDDLNIYYWPTWSEDGTLLVFDGYNSAAQAQGIWAISFPQDLE